MEISKQIDGLTNLKYSYAIVQFYGITELTAAFHAAINYFNQEINCKELNFFSNKYEKGYGRQPGFHRVEGKEFFVIRNQNIPPELKPCIPYIQQVHRFTMECLKVIAKDIQLDFRCFEKLFQKDILPTKDLSSSMLRLFSYNAMDNTSDINPNCPAHEDLGILTIIPKSTVPCLEVFDFIKGSWINVESQIRDNEVLILAGETLALISNNYYLPATHRLRNTAQHRISLVYDLQPDFDASLNSKEFESPIIGKAHVPFSHSYKEFLEKEMQYRTSIHSDY